MRTLAIDFSSSRRGMALVTGASSNQPAILASVQEEGSAGLQALELVEQTLLKAQWRREEVESIVIGLGPGSYTGIRAALALAQGWQIARPIKTLGINSMDILAETARKQGYRGRIAILIDAQRQEFYLTEYEVGDNHSHPIGSPKSTAEDPTEKSGSKTIPPPSVPIRLATIEQVRQLQQSGLQLAGPDLFSVFPEALPIYPDAAVLGTMALDHSDFLPAHELTPIYLRPISFVKAPPPRIIC